MCATSTKRSTAISVLTLQFSDHRQQRLQSLYVTFMTEKPPLATISTAIILYAYKDRVHSTANAQRDKINFSATSRSSAVRVRHQAGVFHAFMYCLTVLLVFVLLVFFFTFFSARKIKMTCRRRHSVKIFKLVNKTKFFSVMLYLKPQYQ